MKIKLFFVLLMSGLLGYTQDTADKIAIENALNSYIDGFYKGDASKLKEVLKPRLYKFGYLKNEQTGDYDYYAKMTFEDAIAFVEKMKKEGRSRDENVIRKVEVLDIQNHIASAKVTAAWGVDFMLLSKDNGKWMIEQVIWEGPYQKTDAKQEPVTTYYLIRHAEKDKSDKANSNPHLTAEGLARADNWSKILQNITFDDVYSTDYYRTIETANPIANNNKLEIKKYDPRNLNLEEFKTNTQGKTILIVGHSNTTPMLANSLLGQKAYDMIDENQNGNLYIIRLNSKGASSELLVIN